MKKFFGAAAFFSLLASQFSFCSAQEQPLKIKLEILGQGEVRRGGMKDSVKYAPNFLVSRERLFVDYSGRASSLLWDAHLTLQHTSIWGMEGGGTLKMFEAWARLRTQSGWFVQMGRQALTYDDERIIGMNDWAMASQSHDALRFGFEGSTHKLHLVATYNQNSDVDETGSNYYANGMYYKTMLIGWYHIQPKDFPASLSLLFMNIGMQAGTKGVDEHNEYQQLYGAYAKFEKPWMTLEGSYYRQGGNEEHGLPIKAWMAAAKATWHPLAKLDLTVGYDYLSGDKDFNVPPDGFIGLEQRKEVNGFSSVWGSHHKFYGTMDFFYVSTYYGGFTPGLRNLYVTADLHPTDNLDFSLGYHYYAMGTHHQDLDLTLGHELEIEGNYAISKEVTLSAGFSYMTGGKTMERLKRVDTDNNLHWGWLCLVFNARSEK